MKSAIRKIMDKSGPPVPFSANAGRSSSFDLRGGPANMETYLNTYLRSGTLRAIVDTLTVSTAMPEWHLYKKQPVDARVRYSTADGGSDQRTEVVQHQALNVWSNPNPFQTRFEFCEGFLQHMELCGEAWWILGREGTNFPTSMWFVRPDRMEPVLSPDAYLQGYVYRSPGGEIVPLSLDEVIVVKTPDPRDQFRGSGPVSSVMPNIEGMRYATEWQRNFFQNEALPGGIIQIPNSLTDAQWEEMSDRWREGHSGVVRAHRVAFLENGATWVPNAITQKDMDFNNLRIGSRDEIREAFGIHGSMIGNSADINRANSQTAEEVFGTWKIIPRLKRIRTALNSRFLPMFGTTSAGIEFDFENPLPDDRETDNAELLSKSQSVQFLVSAGADLQDALEACGLPPMKSAEVKPVMQPALPVKEPQGPLTGDNAKNSLSRMQDFVPPQWKCWNKEAENA